MWQLRTALGKWFRENTEPSNKRELNILYRVVEVSEDFHLLAVHRINTKAIIKMTIQELVYDKDILYGLHPYQACFVGLQYAEIIKAKTSNLAPDTITSLYDYCQTRYGKYQIIEQTRNKDIIFQNTITNQIHTMEPRDVALSEEIISEFDAIQSFYIGLLAGLRINKPITKHKKPVLRIVR